MRRLISAVCKSLLLSPVTVKELSQDLHAEHPRLFCIKISFNIYCVRNVDQAFYESLYLLNFTVNNVYALASLW